jgi:hypothetical protein
MKNQPLVLTSLVVLALLVAGIVYYGNSGYGKVSADAYEIAKALYGTCLAESDERLNRVALLLDEPDDAPDSEPLEITEKERRWLNSILKQAREGDWKSAASSARRMMEDQVE